LFVNVKVKEEIKIKMKMKIGVRPEGWWNVEGGRWKGELV